MKKLKFKWVVDPKPTGRCTSFNSRRSWPHAEYPNGEFAARIHCEGQDYVPHIVKTGQHPPLSIRIHNQSKIVNSSRAPDTVIGSFKTLDDAKKAFAKYMESDGIPYMPDVYQAHIKTNRDTLCMGIHTLSREVVHRNEIVDKLIDVIQSCVFTEGETIVRHIANPDDDEYSIECEFRSGIPSIIIDHDDYGYSTAIRACYVDSGHLILVALHADDSGNYIDVYYSFTFENDRYEYLQDISKISVLVPFKDFNEIKT